MFDRVLTQSVLNHLDRDGIEQTVSRVASVLAPDGWWLGTAQFDDAADPVLLGATRILGGGASGSRLISTSNGSHPCWPLKDCASHECLTSHTLVGS